ncbi:hypothetical protein CIL05_17160 [Virgibacillus profundi]|uniref:Hydroxyacid dehydrogenase n=1 Tax=Virgibacillus profundi TaxID=2024555 RepID=A0A2A2I9W0_9BACI|nr:hydroxyacid dehydrogenase [Virgibacillus profundi]PAV28362.1 hypothetical protein CIL05_17160 [Virgibacillus profundi]PXY52276.1 hypothetical protein CIT14_18615 [Virgibacillus profundi]
MKNVLFIEPTIRPIGVNFLGESFNVFYAPDGEEERLIKIINEENIHAVITRTETITERLIKSCPSLEVIGQHGVGVNNIDVKAASKASIYVVNVPDANFISVAEHTMMAVLALSKNLNRNHEEVKDNNWNYREEVYPAEISDKNIFIVGFGNVGRRVANLAKAFNMNIYAYDPFVEKNFDNVVMVDSLIEGLKIADYTSLHLPLLKSTDKLISTEEINHMRKRSFLINVSRGRIIDQQALTKALQKNMIAGAALDVLEEEPPNPKDPLLRLRNVIFTPHLAGDTLEAKNRCSRILSKEVTKVLNGNLSSKIINKEIISNPKIGGIKNGI